MCSNGQYAHFRSSHDDVKSASDRQWRFIPDTSLWLCLTVPDTDAFVASASVHEETAVFRGPRIMIAGLFQHPDDLRSGGNDVFLTISHRTGVPNTGGSPARNGYEHKNVERAPIDVAAAVAVGLSQIERNSVPLCVDGHIPRIGRDDLPPKAMGSVTRSG